MSAAPGFAELLSMAEDNSRRNMKEMKKNEGLFQREKKLDPKKVKLNMGVQRFLARKEEEERKKREEEERKRRKLMALRNQDRKATSRVRRMVNMTKSANKAVIAEARESLKDSVDEQAIASEAQPDEDDYGYTSTYANELYKKMMEKYKDDAKKDTRNKPRQDLNPPKIQTVKSNGHSNSASSAPNGNGKVPQADEKGKGKKKPPPPPPPSFHDLLRLAEEKSKEPIILKNPMSDDPKGPETFEFGRPMNARQKKEFMRELELKKRVAAQFSGDTLPEDFWKDISSAQVGEPRRAPMKNVPTIPKIPAVPQGKSSGGPPKVTKTDPMSVNGAKPNNPAISVPHSSHLRAKEGAPVSDINKKTDKIGTSPSSKPNFAKKSSPTSRSQSNGYPSSRDPHCGKQRERPDMVDKPVKRKPNEEVVRAKPRPRRSSEDTAILPSSSNYKKPSHRFPLNPYLDQDKPLPRFQPEREKGRPVFESEEEYDSEMDDFIDDSDVHPSEISKMIGEMFKYNKRQYADEESDDEAMESNFFEQQREEARSLRIGVKEDMEDIKREEEEKRRKMMMLKKRRVH